MVTLDEVPEAVQAVLVEFFAQQRNHLAGIQPEAVDVLEQFVLGGGKRLRPLFAWFGGSASGVACGEFLGVDPGVCPSPRRHY